MANRKLDSVELITNSQRMKKQVRKASEHLSNILNSEYDLTIDEKNDLTYMMIQLSNMKKRQNLKINENYGKVGYYNVSKY